MASLSDRWKKDEPQFERVQIDYKAKNLEIYRPVGVNTDEIDATAERILLTALKKHSNAEIGKTEIEQAESDWYLLRKLSAHIKDELYIKRLVWETATEVDYIKGLKPDLSPRLAKRAGLK